MPRMTVGEIESLRRAIQPPRKECNCGKKPVKKVMTNCPVCGFVDPLPSAELQPVPLNWAKRGHIMMAHKAALQQVLERDICAPGNLEGSGIVLVGEGKYWAGIVIAVKLLRELGCTLPVQIWHNGEIGNQLGGIENLKIIDAREFGKDHPARIMRGWEIKTYALLHSGFKKAIYLDADAYCVADPSPLFSLLDDHSLVYWSDFESNKRNVTWSAFGVGDNSFPAVQGGQLLIDLEKCWREIFVAHWLNMHSDYSYSFAFGDQDTLRVALSAIGGKYRCLGPAHWQQVAFICSHERKPYIVHRCQGKLYLPWDGGSKPPCYALPLEKRVFELFNEQINNDPHKVFSDIYKRKVWGNGSGAGSSENERKEYLSIVQNFIAANGVKSVVDLGSGDGEVIRRIKAPQITAVEIHAPLVEKCSSEVPEITWLNLNLDADRESLPSGDLCLIKDVAHHWPNDLIVSFLGWVRECGKWKHVLITQDSDQRQADCQLGGYRALDMNKYPLNLFPLRKIADYLHKSVLQLV